jgi:hypothetical protein
MLSYFFKVTLCFVAKSGYGSKFLDKGCNGYGLMGYEWLCGNSGLDFC